MNWYARNNSQCRDSGSEEIESGLCDLFWALEFVQMN